MADTIKPVQSLISPEPGSSVTTTNPSIIWTITDDGGSGINLYSISCDLDGDTYDMVNGIDNYWSITGGYRLMVVPYGTLSEGYHYVTLRGSDNNGNAAPVIYTIFRVDLTPPTLTLTSPANNLTTVGSSVMVAGSVAETPAGAVTISVKVNGTDIASVTTYGDFSTYVPIASGANTIVVTATDGAGYTDSATRTVTRQALSLVTNRTQADVDYVKLLQSVIKDGTASAAQIAEYTSAPIGMYSASDVNRVSTAVNAIATELTAAGYPVTGGLPTNRVNSDEFLQADQAALLAAVADIRSALAVYPTTPATPANIRGWKQANAIEQILQDVFQLYQNMIDAYYYMGDLYMGEV